MNVLRVLAVVIFSAQLASAQATTRPSYSGVYPHLAFFNDERECGTGAVVPWAGRLWAVTYAPHSPNGSSDKLYEIDDELNLVVRPESVGGTPANRMIHRESNQLFVGPYVIDDKRSVRVIPYAKMPGRPTANARHLTSPAERIYYATMEEGLYDVDVRTLEVKTLFPDGNTLKDIANPRLPGYHGKGAYSGQSRLVYANNGEHSQEARKRPDVPSGCLAEWDGREWRVVRRNQFTDVTGPGGIYGNEKPETDPIWSIGWDHKSLILMVLDGGKWHTFRLPKATHTYDGAHGWNTEWPRIRDIGEDDLLMTMHGTFWRFPRGFSAANSRGIRPRSTHLKVIGDFARWNDRIVFGCDDTAKSEFLNKRAAKGELAPPGQSQSNLWFVEPAKLDNAGPTRGSAIVWLNETLKGGQWSDPYLFSGYERRGLYLVNYDPDEVTFDFEIDGYGGAGMRLGSGRSYFLPFGPFERGEWIRLKAHRDCAGITAILIYSAEDKRTTEGTGKDAPGALLHARGDNKRTLAVTTAEQTYEWDGAGALAPSRDAKLHDWIKENVAIPQGVLSVDAASVIFTDDNGKRWRLPKADQDLDDFTGKGAHRICREVCTERDLFNAHGTFYELPAENAGGFAKVRPVATHERRIVDYCSYRGMLIMSGIDSGDEHMVRSVDGKVAIWAGVVDDLWSFGKPRGRGGPWKDSAVKAGVTSDPYLMNGYDVKRLALTSDRPCKFKVEVDLTGDGNWFTYERAAERPFFHDFPYGYNAYWIRFTSDTDCTATAQLEYK